MKFTLVLALAGLSPILAAQTKAGDDLGVAKLASGSVLAQPTVTAVSATYAMKPEEILIQGKALGSITHVKVGYYHAAIIERREDFLRVGILTGHAPGYWPVELGGKAGTASAQTELWPTIKITKMDGLHDPIGGYRPADGIYGVNVHNGTAGVFVLAASLNERPLPIVMANTGFWLCLEEPMQVLAIAPIPDSGVLRQQLRLPYIPGGTLYLQGWASQFRPIGSEACFTNMEAMTF